MKIFKNLTKAIIITILTKTHLTQTINNEVPFPCSTTTLRETSYLRNLLFDDLESCCKDLVLAYNSCNINTDIDTCTEEFKDFTTDFCELLGCGLTKWLCKRASKSWASKKIVQIEEEYAKVQETCIDVQLCTEENTTTPSGIDINDEELCLDHLGRARKVDGEGYMFRVIHINEDIYSLQSVDSGLCISNASNEIYMNECDVTDSKQFLEVSNGVNSLESNDFVLKNDGECLAHAQDPDEPSLFLTCDSSYSGNDWQFLTREGSRVTLPSFQ